MALEKDYPFRKFSSGNKHCIWSVTRTEERIFIQKNIRWIRENDLYGKTSFTKAEKLVILFS